MKRLLITVLTLFFCGLTWAHEGAEIALAKASIDPSDMAAIKRGAKTFAANCMACHTLVYLRYDKVAQEAGITYDKMPINVTSWPQGVKPPDLSLEADVRGVDWIYTYLHSFYQDTSRPNGVNNLLVPGTAMSGILTPYQGIQILVSGKSSVTLFHDVQWYDLLVLQKQGSLSPEEFDAMVNDLVNFLDYAAQPYQQQQHQIGWWVLGFLVLLFVMVFFLKKEYWRDVKKPEQHHDDDNKHD